MRITTSAHARYIIRMHARESVHAYYDPELYTQDISSARMRITTSAHARYIIRTHARESARKRALISPTIIAIWIDGDSYYAAFG